ncbi:MAG: signal peptidase I [Verrucomicrobiota bacterium]
MFKNFQFRKYHKWAESVIQYLRKERKYSHDILSIKDLQKYDDALLGLEKIKSMECEAVEMETHVEAFMKKYEALVLPNSERNWRENVEVFFVALVIALGIRAYILQPFKIPTHSMKPSLYGVLCEPRQGEKKPNFFKCAVDFLIFGKTYHRIEVKTDGVLHGVKESRILGVLPSKITEFYVGMDRYWVWASLKQLSELGYSYEMGQKCVKGEELVNFSEQAGDHLFVNKIAYHFRLPKRGEVFVFTTQDIELIEANLQMQNIEGAQYYIKRCVGIGGDALRIVPPYLYINGDVQRGKSFERVYSMKNGYNGYVLGGNYMASAEDTYQLMPDRFWAMGDNSRQSLDSRFWGPVPRKNLVGSAWVVYWPFGKRWGWID